MKVLLMNEKPKKKKLILIPCYLIIALCFAAVLCGIVHRGTGQRNGMDLDPDAVVTQNTSSAVQYGGTGVVHKGEKTLDYVFTNPKGTGKYYRFKIVKGKTDIAASGIIAPGYEVKGKKNIHVANLEQGTADARIEVVEIEPKTQDTKEQQEMYVCLKVLP